MSPSERAGSTGSPIDPTAPKPPVITSNGPYTECAADACVGNGGPGIAGTFTLAPNPADTDTDITGYRWRLLTSTTSTIVNSTTSTQISVTPPLAGLQILSVEARDAHDRWGPPQEFSFAVASPSGPVGRWHFDDGTQGSAVTTAVDSATEGVRHDATLHTTGADWSPMARRGGLDQSLWLNDTTDTTRQGGYAATAAPAVNTQESFTVSTWAYLTDATTNHVVLAAPGTHTSAFALYYSATARKWVFNRTDRDSDQPAYIRSSSDAQEPPLKVWTHLAGVFDTKGDTDRTNDTIQLFVNGRPQGQPVVAAQAAATYEPWQSTEGLQFGRHKSQGIYDQYFRGRIDEVQLWQQALAEADLRQDARLLDADGQPGVELVASWDATSATGTQIPQSSPYPAGPMILSGGAVLDEAANELVLNGTTAYAHTTGPVIDETGSFTVTAKVRLNSQQLADKPIGYTAQIVGQQSGQDASWALWFEKTFADGGIWRFVRHDTDSTGAVIATATASSQELAELDTWVQLTGVFDASEEWSDAGAPRYGALHLMVGRFHQGMGEDAGFAAEEQGSGELAIGRGSNGGTPGRYLPGTLAEVRVWVGGMTPNQVSTHVLADG
ncbi:hypothetical protein AQ490_17290 [Wenjunlia vitaminophila]|uniref:LamG-like jellyroll fold domain-containing protein n=1 Tax=Wenjunlia vitaminophila TaxID=76728 RepID=A0A0T6LVM8_WENVI|nr:LamG domain-containing protein [Wenjunlia vitaminophila]KRV50155.1 hypothetical protein AQ490_17290 [Wenjunlia vitaminophila]